MLEGLVSNVCPKKFQAHIVENSKSLVLLFKN